MRTSKLHDAGKTPTDIDDGHISSASIDAVSTSAPPAAKRTWWHRLLRWQAIPDIHGVYGFFHTVRVHDQPLAVLSWPSTRHHVFWPGALKRLLPAINHLAMLLALLRVKRDRVILVREFDNLWFLLVSPAFWLLRHRVVLNINQNFSRPIGVGVRARALSVLSRMGFRFLWLDGAGALPDIRARFPRLVICTPLFPVHERQAVSRQEGSAAKFTVGLVGYFREDKGGVAKAVALANELSRIPGVQVSAGFWNDVQRQQFCAVASPDITTCSTYEVDDYHSFLGQCHAVVILAERDAYYYRHSGILVDCIGNGTLPVCPAYPLLESIVMRPAPVGAVYGEGEKLRCVVMRVLAQYDRLRGNFAVHAAVRTPEQVSAALEDLLRPQCAARTPAAMAAK